MIALAKPQLNSIDEVIHGEALAVLRTLPDNSVDAIVCDPPAGISFMGKEWDNADTWPLEAHPGKRLTGSGNPTSAHGFGSDIRINPGKKERDAFISFITAIMAEALRVLKPGGHAFVWALPRTSHWTGMALEDAGFEIRDVITHLFGSGFPKSMDVSKAIDKMHGAEREVIGIRSTYRPNSGALKPKDGFQDRSSGLVTASATPEASQWDGWGTALKPASEHWYLARKPLSEKSIAENVLKWGTGGLNIDSCRVGTADGHGGGKYSKSGYSGLTGYEHDGFTPSTQGRWPSNLLLSHSVWCVPNVEDWLCDESCPVRLLDEQSGIRKHGGPIRTNGIGMFHKDRTEATTDHYSDQGGSSRYFQRFAYIPKASRAERNRGCEGLPEKEGFDKNTSKQIAHINHATGATTYNEYHPSVNANSHPTVKPVNLMRYLVRMITPPGGIVLDCFAGSGSTLVAAIHEGMHFIGIEMNDSEQEPYVTIARARIEQAFREVQS